MLSQRACFAVLISKKRVNCKVSGLGMHSPRITQDYQRLKERVRPVCGCKRLCRAETACRASCVMRILRTGVSDLAMGGAIRRSLVATADARMGRPGSPEAEWVSRPSAQRTDARRTAAPFQGC